VFTNHLHDHVQGATRVVRPHAVASRSLLVLLLLPVAAGAQPSRPAARETSPTLPPAWVYPLVVQPAASVDSTTPRHVPGSRVTYTQARALDRFDVPDWFPHSHPPMPPSVARGQHPAAWACAFCHLPDGGGRPENAALAGLPADYIVRQVEAMRDGTRDLPWRAPTRPMDSMRRVAVAVTDTALAEAARYYAGLPARRRARVVETTRIPRVRGALGLYLLSPEGGRELLGQRLVEVPVDAARHELHDARVEYVAYVPPGSVARGRALATRGVPGAQPSCVSCHGAALRGVGLTPPLAGRSPSYLLRQLFAFAAGTRTDSVAAPMRAVARALSVDDMIGVAAYAASLRPSVSHHR
jgi:cytochrome c553